MCFAGISNPSFGWSMVIGPYFLKASPDPIGSAGPHNGPLAMVILIGYFNYILYVNDRKIHYILYNQQKKKKTFCIISMSHALVGLVI